MLQGLVKFFHQLRNPHCADCKAERDEELERVEHEKMCSSCETLRNQLDIANSEKLRLLDAITRVPEPVEAPNRQPLPITRPTKHMPWPARRQMLEREDRERAKLIKNAPKPDPVTVTTTPESSFETVPSNDPETEALEKELLSAQTQRETAS